jgi:hypothetical protein
MSISRWIWRNSRIIRACTVTSCAGRRFVGQQHGRPAGDRHRDHHSLPHANTQL